MSRQSRRTTNVLKEKVPKADSKKPKPKYRLKEPQDIVSVSTDTTCYQNDLDGIQLTVPFVFNREEVRANPKKSIWVDFREVDSSPDSDGFRRPKWDLRVMD